MVTVRKIMNTETILSTIRILHTVGFFASIVNSIFLSSIQEYGKTALLNTLKQPIRDFCEDSSEDVAVRFNYVTVMLMIQSLLIVCFLVTNNTMFVKILAAIVCLIFTASYSVSTLPFFFCIETGTIDSPLRDNISIDVIKDSIRILFLLTVLSAIWDFDIPTIIMEKLASDLSNNYLKCLFIALIIAYVIFLISSCLICCYCIIGCLFFDNQQSENKKEIDNHIGKIGELHEKLRMKTRVLNEQARKMKKWRIISLSALGLKFLYDNIIIFFREFSINCQIAFQLVKYRINGILGKLLTNSSYCNAKRRILFITTLTVLIINNLVVDNFYGSDHHLAVFFRLITTIVAIPILINKLSS